MLKCFMIYTLNKRGKKKPWKFTGGIFMKKLSVLITLFLFFSFILLFGETEKKTTVFHGYGNLKWGSSLETVKLKYKNLLKGKTKDEGSVLYEQIEPNKLIQNRSFCFFKNKLYKVAVFYYDDVTTETWNAILKKIISIFGTSHSTVPKKSFDNDFYIDGYTFCWAFNNDTMYVELKTWDYLDADGFKVGTLICSLYICNPILKELKKSQVKDFLNDLDDL